MLDIIKTAIAFLQAVAAKTTTTIDNKVVAILSQVLGNEVILKIIVDLIDGWLADPQKVREATEEALTAEQREALIAAKIDWQNLLALVMKILEMLDMFMEPQVK